MLYDSLGLIRLARDSTAAAAVVILLTSGSVHAGSERANRATQSSAPIVKKTFVGRATVYSSRLSGRKTADGERFHQTDNTAATNALPLGSKARVTNLNNHQKTEVKVTDRTGRRRRHRAVIDLSKHAAQQLGMDPRHGTAPVKVEELASP